MPKVKVHIFDTSPELKEFREQKELYDYNWQ